MQDWRQLTRQSARWFNGDTESEEPIEFCIPNLDRAYDILTKEVEQSFPKQTNGAALATAERKSSMMMGDRITVLRLVNTSISAATVGASAHCI